MDLKDKKQQVIEYLNLCRKKLKDNNEDDSNTFVVFGYILELLKPAEQTEINSVDLKEKVLKSLEDDYGWSGVRRLDQMHVELIKDVINILTEPAEQSEPLTNDQILTVFGKYRDDYYISGGKFIDAVREIVSSLKPEQTCEHWQSVQPGKWQCNHEVVTAIEELKVSNKKILDGMKNGPNNNMVFGAEPEQKEFCELSEIVENKWNEYRLQTNNEDAWSFKQWLLTQL